LLTTEDNLLFQSYFTFVLLVELQNNKFLESQSFAALKFGSPWIKEELQNIGVGNQGCALIALYVMLVIPRELIAEKYPDEYEDIRAFLESHTQNTRSTYKSDKMQIDFLYHIRNAVAHARVSFRRNEVIVFTDSNKKGETFESELSLQYLGELVQRLQGIHLKYVQYLQQSR